MCVVITLLGEERGFVSLAASNSHRHYHATATRETQVAQKTAGLMDKDGFEWIAKSLPNRAAPCRSWYFSAFLLLNSPSLNLQHQIRRGNSDFLDPLIFPQKNNDLDKSMQRKRG